MGMACFKGVRHTKEMDPIAPQFYWCLSLCLHPLFQNDRIRRGNTYKEKLLLRGQPHRFLRGQNHSVPHFGVRLYLT